MEEFRASQYPRYGAAPWEGAASAGRGGRETRDEYLAFKIKIKRQHFCAFFFAEAIGIELL